MMMFKLAVFDVDGTIAQKGVVPQEVFVGLKNLREKGAITTVSTGRGYTRLRQLLGNDFDNVISKDALLITEHGTRIVDYDGKDVFVAEFSPEEIEHVTDFLRANIDIANTVWFNPGVPSRPQFWTFDPRQFEIESVERGSYGDVSTGSITELHNRLLAGVISSVGVKLKPFVGVENLKLHFTRTNTDVIFQDGNMEFIKNNVNKAIALRYLLRHFDLDDDSLLVAGNAINDAEMLDGYAKMRILVGGTESDTVLGYLSDPDTVARVESPVALGRLLQAL